MTNYYRRSQSDRISKLEKKLVRPKNPLLLVDLNKDGTYGKDSLAENQLSQYIKENDYDVVIIDDIINMSD